MVPISCTNVQRLAEAEKQTNEYKEKIDFWNKHLTYHITTRDNDNDITAVPDWNWQSIDEHYAKLDEDFKKVIGNNGVTKVDDNNTDETPDIFDSYINMEVGIPRGSYGELSHETVKQRVIDDDGKPLGVWTSNQINDRRLYEVNYLDGTVKTLAANVIA